MLKLLMFQKENILFGFEVLFYYLSQHLVVYGLLEMNIMNLVVLLSIENASRRFNLTSLYLF